LQKQEELEKFMKKIISEISKDEEHTLDNLEKKLDKIAERIEKHGNS
jgi:RNA binding exosome subunit